MPEAGARRPQPHRKIGATTLPMYRRRGVWRPSKTHCALRGAITFHDSDDDEWEDTTEQYTSTRERK